MTYYEELGVASSAPASKIRQEYRVFARLVHPDGQVDEQVRGMAERQMKRLNEILETLLDARRRREYDQSLLAPDVAPAAMPAAKPRHPAARFRPPRQARWGRVPGWASAVLVNWFWIVPAAVIAGVGCWFVAAGSGRQPAAAEAAQPAPGASARKARQDTREVTHPRAAVARTGKTGAPPPVETAAHRAPVRSLPAAATPVPSGVAVTSGSSAASSPEAPHAPPRPEASDASAFAAQSAMDSSASPHAPPFASPSAPARLGPFSAPPSATQSVVPSSASPPGPAARPAAPSFAGAWLYVPESEDSSAPGVYPPTYVEFLLTEDHGELSGSYRARYRIPDRAMSAEVVFRAQGKPPEGESAKLGWTSADGARGEVEVRLHGPNAMSVTWWTTELGRHPVLASGSAKLLRQQAP